MKEKLMLIQQDAEAKILEAKTEAQLQEVKVAVLGKQGSLTEILKELVGEDRMRKQ